MIIVSTKGVYIAHLWEVPVFSSSDDNTFLRLGFNVLRDGDGFWAQSFTVIEVASAATPFSFCIAFHRSDGSGDKWLSHLHDFNGQVLGLNS